MALAPAASARTQATTCPPHSRLDDAQALATSVVLVSLGLALLGSAGLLTGGTAGLALLLSYASGWPLGVALFLVNLPFYALAWRALGAGFTCRTLVAVTVLSAGVEVVGGMLSIQAIHPLYAAIAGGTIIGLGLLVMFRHGASYGGVNVLALHLHERFGWSAGAVQLAIDAAILGAALAIIEPARVGWSLIGGAAVNAVLIWNHRPGRYVARPGRPGPLPWE